MSGLRLRADVHIHVAYDDQTGFGSPVTERPDWSMRQIYAPVIEFAERHGGAALTEAPRLLADVINGQPFTQLAELDGAEAWRIRDGILYPDSRQALPQRITLMREDADRQMQVGLPLDYWPLAHDLIAGLSAQAGLDEQRAALQPDIRSMLELMKREDMVVASAGHAGPATTAALTFVGHNTAVVRSLTTAVLVDPLLFAGGRMFPEQYQPLQAGELGPIDAILITHSHVDHFDSASLLRFPAATRVIIPRIDRETLLAVHLERRLRELGFTNVTTLEWWQSTLVGDIEVRALPFHGEQPTDSDVLHPTVRNAGNTYWLRTPSFSAAFLADSGRDGQGDVRDVVARARAEMGPIDVLFSGYRGWLMYPVQHLFSSVARYMPFVPRSLWGVRQQLMTTADDAIDLAERWGARYLVPYADGGAPWHWRIGLGPRLDEAAEEMGGFDPFPERVRLAARARTRFPDGSALASIVSVLTLRPGESLSRVAEGASIEAAADHVWPYGEQVITPARSSG